MCVIIWENSFFKGRVVSGDSYLEMLQNYLIYFNSKNS